MPDIANEVDRPAYTCGLDALEDGAATNFDDMVDAAAVRLVKEVRARSAVYVEEESTYNLEHLLVPVLGRRVVDNVVCA